MTKPILSLICAMDNNQLIGNNNQLPWHLPADLALFQKYTMGKPVIMGRKTFDSIGQPLPGRHNIVITSNQTCYVEGCTIANSIDQALKLAGHADEVMCIGGASLFQQTIQRADRLYLTRINHIFDGDTWFPEFKQKEWQVVEEYVHRTDENNTYPFSFMLLTRHTGTTVY